MINRLAGGVPIPFSSTGVTIVSNIINRIAQQAVPAGVFMKVDASDEEIAIVQDMVAKADEEESSDVISYALSVNGYYLHVYRSTSPTDEPSIAYLIAYGSGASIKFIQGADYVVR